MVGVTSEFDGADDAAAKRLVAVVDTAADAIVVINEVGRIETFNQAAERMFGYERAEVIGQNVSLLMPPSQGSRHGSYVANYLQTGETNIIGISRETVGRRKNGNMFPIELAVSEIADPNSHLFTGVIRDISERRHVEAEVVHESLRQQQQLGCDLHDGICQEMAGIAFVVQSLHERIRGGQTLEAEALARVTGLMQDAVRHARELADDIHPVRPQPDGLHAALQQLATDTSQIPNVKCTFKRSRTVLVYNAMAAMCFYRIAREAIRRAVSEGKADRIEIQLAQKRCSLVLGVTDNAQSISVNERYRENMLLGVMQYWAKAIGAKVLVNPTKTRGGLRLVCELPTQTKARRND